MVQHALHIQSASSTVRKNFYSIFRIHPDTSIEPLRRIRIGGVEFGPGVRFTKGVAFSGIDLTSYIGRDFEAEEQTGVLVLKGVY